MFKGYCLKIDGTHTVAKNLKDPTEAFKYINSNKNSFYEVRVVDETNFIVLQSRKGEMIFPTLKEFITGNNLYHK